MANVHITARWRHYTLALCCLASSVEIRRSTIAWLKVCPLRPQLRPWFTKPNPRSRCYYEMFNQCFRLSVWLSTLPLRWELVWACLPAQFTRWKSCIFSVRVSIIQIGNQHLPGILEFLFLNENNRKSARGFHTIEKNTGWETRGCRPNSEHQNVLKSLVSYLWHTSLESKWPWRAPDSCGQTEACLSINAARPTCRDACCLYPQE